MQPNGISKNYFKRYKFNLAFLVLQNMVGHKIKVENTKNESRRLRRAAVMKGLFSPHLGRIVVFFQDITVTNFCVVLLDEFERLKESNSNESCL